MSVPELLKSKRFWSAVIGFVVLVVSSLDPRLSENLNIIAPAVVGIVGLLVGGYTIEQTAQAWKNPPKA